MDHAARPDDAPPRPAHGVIGKFLKLAGAQWVRDTLHTLFLILLARQGASEYGGFMVAFGLAQFILFLGEFGLNQPLVGALSRKYGPKGEIVAQYTVIKAVLYGVGLLGVAAFAWQQGYDPGLFWLALAISAGVGLEPLAGTFFVACRVRGRQDQEALIRAAAAVLGYGFGFGALYAGADIGVVGLFKVVENLANLVGGFIAVSGRERLSGLRLGRKALPRVWAATKGGMIFLVMALAAITYNKSNLFFLQRHGGQEAVAQYSVTWELVDGVSVLVCSLLLSNVLFPLFVKMWRTEREEFHRLAERSAQLLLALALPVVFALSVESDRLIGLIYGSVYDEAAGMQRWLVYTIPCAFIHNLAAYLMLSQGKERLLLVIYLGGLVANLILCATLIPAEPLFGATLSILLTKAAVAVATTGYCQRTVGLFTARTLFPVALAAVIGAALYLVLSPLVWREAAEAAAVAPMIVFLLRQMKGRRGLAAS